jgi:exodeoxyribonuclease-3
VTDSRRAAASRGRRWVFRRTCYQIATAGVAQAARAATIYKDARFSDHAPLTIEYDLPL